jgi:signal transduction histidine kinase
VPGALASLVHWRIDVTTSPDPSTSRAGSESRRGGGARSPGSSQAALYAALNAQAADLAVRWKVQVQRILFLDAPRSDDRTGPAPVADIAPELTNVLLAALDVSGEASEGAAVATGLQFGADAFSHGASLHHTVKAVNALCAMIMQTMERAAAENETSTGSVADGVWLAQRLQERAGVLSLAAIRGHAQAHGDALRDRFRHLRHDLRNPLGTIKSVLALMDDESVPAEARANANFRAMAKRNARSLEEMIADRLGDTAVPLPAMVDRDVAVQEVAESVRRELGSEAKRRSVTVVIDASDIRGRFDVSGLELLLQAVLEAALHESRAGEQLDVTFDETSEGRVAIHLSHASSRVPISRRAVLDRLASLARRIGATATFAEAIVISLPMHGRPRGVPLVAEGAMPGETTALNVAETSHNLRSSREDDHGQASVL